VEKYKFQEQERNEELGLNWDSFKWRNYDYAIGRFMNVDPLAEKYNYWTPYAFSGNRLIDARELEGLEPVKVGKNEPYLIVTVNGRAGGGSGDKIVNNNTLVMNLPSPYNQGDDGLSMLGSMPYDVSRARIINYAGSDSGITATHIAQTLKNYRENNPKGKIFLIGHSLGGKDALMAANMANKVTIDLLVTMEAASKEGGALGSAYSTSVGNNVLNLVNFNSGKGGDYSGGGGVGVGNTNTNIIKLPNGTNHTNMDNTLLPHLPTIINQIIDGANPSEVMKNYNYNDIRILNNGDINGKEEGSSLFWY